MFGILVLHQFVLKFKRLVDPKMKILSSFTHPHDVVKLMTYFLSFVELIYQNVQATQFYTMKIVSRRREVPKLTKNNKF